MVLRGAKANVSSPITVTLAGIIIVSSLVCLKDIRPKLASLLVPEKVTDVSLLASRNAKLPMDSTFSEIVMEVSERSNSKAWAPMVTTLVGTTYAALPLAAGNNNSELFVLLNKTPSSDEKCAFAGSTEKEVRAEVCWNALFPILVTLAGIVTEVRASAPENGEWELSPMARTPSAIAATPAHDRPCVTTKSMIV